MDKQCQRHSCQPSTYSCMSIALVYRWLVLLLINAPVITRVATNNTNEPVHTPSAPLNCPVASQNSDTSSVPRRPTRSASTLQQFFSALLLRASAHRICSNNCHLTALCNRRLCQLCGSKQTLSHHYTGSCEDASTGGLSHFSAITISKLKNKQSFYLWLPALISSTAQCRIFA